MRTVLICGLIFGSLAVAQPPKKAGKPDMRALDKPVAMPASSIQWFATLASAQAEAERTNRPMLLITGTPHCAGVSGIW